jgi:hypothetical protein
MAVERIASEVAKGFDPDSLPIRELTDQYQQAAWSCKKKL